MIDAHLPKLPRSLIREHLLANTFTRLIQLTKSILANRVMT